MQTWLLWVPRVRVDSIVHLAMLQADMPPGDAEMPDALPDALPDNVV